ncbi:MAG TPA: TraR/DksA family transcriptional regulator [Candidatus Dormibacteraeota bacterium]|nr:TraR/DksA family transcriptional regulator [Candidatus Dormibacteraeota bacterium]
MIHRKGQRTARENREVRVRLAAMAEALEQRQDVLASAWDSVREEVVDEVDRALQNSDARFSIALDSAISEARASIAHAIAVLDAGGYGSCEDCGSPISEARLSFRPESTRCLHCQDLADRRGGASLEMVDRAEPTNLGRLVSRPEGGGGRIVSLHRFSSKHPA